MRVFILMILLFSLGCDKGGGSATTPRPKASINDVSQNEGNTGTTNFGFTITLSNAYPEPVTVTYSTTEGSARAGEDYTAVTNQSVVFQPNEVQKIVNISVVGDDSREGDDMFTVMITGVTNGTIDRFMGTGTVINDDIRVAFTNAGYNAPTSYAGYTLAWEDNFDGPSLNAASWDVEGGDGCPNLCGWGNNELEYYTGRPENLFFQDGKMLIEARKESYNGRNYTSSKNRVSR